MNSNTMNQNLYAEGAHVGYATQTRGTNAGTRGANSNAKGVNTNTKGANANASGAGSGGAGVDDAHLPLGVRNNNPLNIRYSKNNNWLGINPNWPQQGGFCRFVTMDMGLRAAIRLIKTYYIKYGLCTPTQIITRWAPPFENQTDLYIRCVCARSGLLPNYPVSLELNGTVTRAYEEASDLSRLVAAMARQECGMDINPLYIDNVRRRFSV